jgi:hypothetical protein
MTELSVGGPCRIAGRVLNRWTIIRGAVEGRRNDDLIQTLGSSRVAPAYIEPIQAPAVGHAPLTHATVAY